LISSQSWRLNCCWSLPPCCNFWFCELTFFIKQFCIIHMLSEKSIELYLHLLQLFCFLLQLFAIYFYCTLFKYVLCEFFKDNEILFTCILLENTMQLLGDSLSFRTFHFYIRKVCYNPKHILCEETWENL